MTKTKTAETRTPTKPLGLKTREDGDETIRLFTFSIRQLEEHGRDGLAAANDFDAEPSTGPGAAFRRPPTWTPWGGCGLWYAESVTGRDV